jgi:hypothetical protein
MTTAEAHAVALLMETPTQQMSMVDLLPKLLDAGFNDVIHGMGGPSGFFNACAQLVLVGDNLVATRRSRPHPGLQNSSSGGTPRSTWRSLPAAVPPIAQTASTCAKN